MMTPHDPGHYCEEKPFDTKINELDMNRII